MSTHESMSGPVASRVESIARGRLRTPEDVARIESRAAEDLRPADTILGCLIAAASADPDKAAILQVEEPNLLEPVQTLSYADVVAAVEESANVFIAAAAGHSSVVGLMLPMIPAGLTALWGAQTAGTAVPLNPFLEASAALRILEQTGATALITTQELLDSRGGKEAFSKQVPSLRRILVVGESGDPDDFDTACSEYRGRGLVFEPDEVGERDSLVLPTGGTTGDPKLVRMSQVGQLAVAWNVGALMGNEVETVTAHGMPNFHCGGTIVLGLRTLIFGATLLTLTEVGFRSKAVVSQFWDMARHYRVTSVLATPTTAQALIANGDPNEGHRITDFHCGGSSLPMDLIRTFHDRFGIWLRENWGMTEMHGTSTGHYNDGAEPRIGSAGRALPHVKIKAVELDQDGRWVRDCASGESGALLLSSPSITAGYFDGAQDTAFFPDGVPGPEKWGNTGDLGSVDEDGYVWISGRAKDLIIRGGHNIDPRDVEDVLSRHPAVQIAAAVGRPDRSKGELPMAFVQLREGVAAEPSELLNFCRSRVADPAAVPVEVRVLPEIPLTPVGKVAKPVLRTNAILLEVRRLVEGVLTDRVRLVDLAHDGRGQRPQVSVTLAGVDESDPVLDDVREVLRGFTFGLALQTAEA